MSDLADEVVEAAQTILDTIDNDAATDFAEGIMETASSIGDTIDKMEEKGLKMTDAQETALRNMLAGAEKWLEHAD